MDWSPIENPLTRNRTIVIGNMAYNMGEPYDTWVRNKNIRIKRGEAESQRYMDELQAKGITYLGAMPQSIEWLNEILSRATPPDDVPSKIDELVKRYTDAIKISADEKSKVEEELYSNIMTLKIEGRIIGDFQLQPLRDAQMQNLSERLENVEKRTDKNEESIKNAGRPSR